MGKVLTILFVSCFIFKSDMDNPINEGWEDTRYQTIDGRVEVMNEALSELHSLGLLKYSNRNVNVIEYNESKCGEIAASCIRGETILEKEIADNYQEVFTGCVKVCYDRYGRVVSIDSLHKWKNFPTTEYKTHREISITIQGFVFDNGWLNIDDNGEVLWDENPYDDYNTYCKYSLNLVEAVQFILLHEIAHLEFHDSEEESNNYARKTILRIRKKKLEDQEVTLTAVGQFPPEGDFSHGYTPSGAPPPPRN